MYILRIKLDTAIYKLNSLLQPQAYGQVRTWGVVTLLPEKKLHNARKHVLYKCTQMAVKTKTFTILTSNETIIIPKLQWSPDFLNLQVKRKLVRKIR